MLRLCREKKMTETEQKDKMMQTTKNSKNIRTENMIQTAKTVKTARTVKAAQQESASVPEKKRAKRRSLRLALAAVLGLGIMALGARWAYLSAKDALVISEGESLKSIASANAMTLQEGFSDKENLLLSLYGDGFPDEAALSAAMDKVFCDKYYYRPSDYLVVPAEKREVCLRAAASPGTVISGPCLYRNGGYYTFYMTLAVAVGDEPRGVLQFEWNLDRIFRQTETLSNLNINNNGYCIVRNKEGRIVMSAEGGKEDIAPEDFPAGGGEENGKENTGGTAAASQSAEIFTAEKNTAQSEGNQGGVLPPAVGQSWRYDYVNGVPQQRRELSAHASAAVGDEIFTVTVAEDYDLLVKPIEKLSVYLALLGGAFVLGLTAFLWRSMQIRREEERLRLALRYEKELNEVGKTLEKQEEIVRIYNRDKELTALQSTLAHEFNNQMTPIVLYAELLRDNAQVRALAPEETEELYQAAQQCSELSQQMLTFARQARAEKKAVKFNASSEVRTTLRMIEKLLPENVRLEQQLSRREFYLYGQSGMLSQILLNLSNNAIYAMRGREDGVLTVLFGAAKDEEGQLRLVVRDNGCGIPQALQRHVFEPFFTTKPPQEGSGIGLTVVARLVQEHGGMLSAHSKEGEGTEFVIELPYVGVQEAETVPVGGLTV